MDIIKIMKVEYEGLWKNDKKDGQGKYTFKNGDLYIREFKADMFSGRVRNIFFIYIILSKIIFRIKNLFIIIIYLLYRINPILF